MSPTWMLPGGLIVLPLLVVALVGFVWFMVLLWRVRNRPGLAGAT
ncbi:hypothetical protein BCE75_102113 [Isoptericola sp. CG 20/1183]|uniref:Uncharacterized protein n=1 Tax=Isoptericola halotolerans TaxID=300560 RepID=A0ABX5EIF8_9MICO|nr:hypothetical protein [Isoptericola halotolerans]PRZ09404.1 hypothetical protein BCE75_102113 [Isoptericola sp. CG 20/1183]PRZ10205.1 hypothetical protein BCL65_101345 [Isoptericola halotolerans]